MHHTRRSNPYYPCKKELITMILDRIALILTVVGALNWGSIGIFGFDIVAYLCGGQLSAVSRVIFTLVGLAGLWCISLLFRERSILGDGENY